MNNNKEATEQGGSPPQLSVRWAFNISTSSLSDDDISNLLPYLQVSTFAIVCLVYLIAYTGVKAEERLRVNRYYQRADRVRALIGRLMLRHFAHKHINVPYKAIKFTRSELGKPLLVGLWLPAAIPYLSNQAVFTILGKLGAS